ncbi:MAG: hypothetical protein CVV02_05585 [Firmicutes bacterium HGW-Firmicutes-7]|nr:MAG: hypothetical protein CVV02_05585 [Firmicutes bacterium HGW-Firmicutes-7]
MRKNNDVSSHHDNLHFLKEDLVNFSLASHDRSPLHMDHSYAEKTVYGQPMLFGFLGALACLGKIERKFEMELNHVEIKFTVPMYTDIEYLLRVDRDNSKELIEVFDEENTYMSLKTFYKKMNPVVRNTKNDKIVDLHLNSDYLESLQEVSLDYCEQDLQKGVIKTGSYSTDELAVEKLKKQFFLADSVVRPIHIDALMMCSYIAGMILPGRRSLCMKLDMTFNEVDHYVYDGLDYKASSTYYNSSLGILGINIEIYHSGQMICHGELNVCVRKENWLIEASFPIREEVENENTIAIASTFTSEPLLSSLNFWKKELNFSVNIKFAQYNQVFQELLNPSSLLSNNKRGMNVILLRFGDWLRYREVVASNDSNEELVIAQEEIDFLKTTLDKFICALQVFSRRSNAFTILMICPFSVCENDEPKVLPLFDDLENQLVMALKDIKSIGVLNTSQYHIHYGISKIFDPARDKMGHVPFTIEYYNMLGTLVNRRFYQLKNKPYKVIVCDCDNTLWKGVCGEVGAKGVTVKGPYYALQSFLVQQTEQGKLLCLCSKNAEEDAWKVFDEKKSMPLKRKHITASKINWKSKSENIKELAQTLNLGLDSFIFIDDNPLECSEVRANCPEVLTIMWSESVKLLNHFWPLDQYFVTEEDKIRTQLYQANVERSHLEEDSGDYEEFIKSLNLNVEINSATEDNVSRVSQLTERTNQFNFTSIRRKPIEINEIMQGKEYKCLTVTVADRFGSYGLVGVMITKEDKKNLVVDTFLLSCRVLGRGVEYEMIAELGKYAKERNLEKIEILFNHTNKNEPAKLFLQEIGCAYKVFEDKSITTYLIPTDYLSTISMNSTKYSTHKMDIIAHREKQSSHTLSVYTREKEKQLERIYVDLSDIFALSKEIKLLEDQSIHRSITKCDRNQRKDNDDINDATTLFHHVLDEIKVLFSKHLSIPYEELSGEEELDQYHIDSFKIMDIMVSLGNEYLEIPSTLLFECRNLKSIAQYLLENYSEKLKTKYPSIRDKIVRSSISDEKNTIVLDKEQKNLNNLDLNEDVAIIGINGLYPNAKTISEFWNILLKGQDCITEVPRERWNLDLIFDPNGNKPDKTYSKWGAFIDDIDKFEASFFNISPKEAQLMDPQQRLFLQVVWGLLEDAGYTVENIDRNTGVFAAVVASDYGTLADEASLKGISSYRDTDFYQIPNRVSYCYDFNGPSLSINTACSGSGTAVHLAYESLRRRECNTAVVGGINLFIHPSRWIQYAQIHFHSADGVCRPFGKGANGTVFGEGVGAVLLKRLGDAEKDNDNIYGIIRGSAINSGGKTNGFTVPNPKAQAELITKALKQGQVNPRTIGYIEAHGTGTSLGDPIEFRGLTMAFKACSSMPNSQLDHQYCSLGSIKANFGHSESAAALSGMIKTMLQMKYETFVPSLNAVEVNPNIPFDNSPFIVQQKAEKWHRPILIEDGVEKTYPRRAGISSFGAGGSNSHIIIEEYIHKTRNNKVDAPQIIVLSSKNKKKLKQLICNLIGYLEKNQACEFEVRDGNKTITLEQIAYTFQVGRAAMEERVAFLASNMKELIDTLKKLVNDQKNDENIFDGNVKATRAIVKGLYEDESDEFIQLMLRDSKLSKIAQLWVLGVEVKWDLVHDENPGRVSLPGYTFDGEKYWIPNTNNHNAQCLNNNTNSFQLACAVKEDSAIQVENYFGQFESPNDGLYVDEQVKEVTYYTFDFIEEEIFEEEAALVGNILIFDTNEELFTTIKEKYGKDFPVVLVKKGNDYIDHMDGTYEIDFLNKDDYVLLIEEYENKALPNKIIFKWDEKNELAEDLIEKQLEANFCSLLYLSQALMKKMPKEELTLLYVYSSEAGTLKPEHGAMGSFAKTIHQENPRFKYKIIDFNTMGNFKMESAWLADQFIKELNNKDKNAEIMYKEDKRFIKVYKKVEVDKDLNEKHVLRGKKVLREKGVYLITGGLGGLGFIFSQYLARNQKARLILTGRSELDARKLECIDKLISLGSEVIYIRADISSEEDVNNLIVQAKATYNEINGIIHSAGVLKSDFILTKKSEDIKDVFASKVKGAVLLDKATKDENLDFFVLFSSISGFMGSVGYCDYAVANSFMDYYALNRKELTKAGKRKGLSLAIAWPFWDEGGMRLSDWSISNLKNTIGLIPLQTECGIQALLDGLVLQHPNFVVMEGEEEKGLVAFEYNRGASHERIEASLENNDFSDSIGEEQLLQATAFFLKKLLSEETKVPVENIDSKEGLEIYGIDSIMIMSLTSQLEKLFGTLSKTLFFEYQTLEKLSQYLSENFKNVLIEILELAPKQKLEKNSFPEHTLTTKHKKRNEEVSQIEVEKEERNGEATDFAIIGISGQYPEALNLEAFWENLKAGKDSVIEIPQERWDYHIYFDPEKGKEGKVYSKWGAFLDHVDKFDPLFFNISPKEAKIMDPQERIFLQCAWHTFEDAGYSRTNVEGTSIGVFAGVTWGEYQLYGVEETLKGRPISTSSIYASVANRVSYIFNLHGPSIAVDTMCASSLTALHMACESIRTGECSMALAGGVNVSVHPNKYLYLSQGRFASSNGRCKAFGVGGDGYVPGEGVGAVLVKSLKQAELDSDHIYAVIKGTSINHGGKTNGYTVPSPNAQAELVVKALKKAKINPRSISYMEAHGTGTALGDPIEMKGLAKAFGEFTKDTQFCSIGSSKSNIGHLESAAGIAGLTKILLQMKYKMLVPSIHTEELNPNIDFNASPFYVQRELSEWKKPIVLENGVEIEYPRRAAVSSFGAGGSNSHVILEEYDSGSSIQLDQGDAYIIILSAKNSERLKVYAAQLYDFLQKPNRVSLKDMAYTLQVGREAMEERLAIVASSIEQLKERLMDFCNKTNTTMFYQNNLKKDKDKAKLLVGGKAGQAFINTLINERELNRLAALWVMGIEIEWPLLYKGTKPVRLSLPTYPFALESYWIIQGDYTKEVRQEQNKMTKIHPLIDHNTSNFREQKFETRLLGSEFYLLDHIIAGQKLLPGVACLEMATVAGEIAGERKVNYIKDTVWINPIAINENGQDIIINLYPSEHSAEYVISSKTLESEQTVHAQGVIHYDDHNDSKVAEVLDIHAIKNRCPVKTKKVGYYEKLRSLGFNYGPSFQPVQEIVQNRKEVLAYLELPDELISEFNEFTLHPSLIDGALHPTVALLDTIDTDPSTIYLPFMLEELINIKPLVKNCYSYVTLEDQLTPESTLKKYNIKILNELGEVLIIIKAFTTKLRKKEIKQEEIKQVVGIKEVGIEPKEIETKKGIVTENNDERILDLFQKLAQGNLEVNQVERIMRR